MSKNKQYYNWARIKATGATYCIAIGGRNIGKSYSAKMDILKDAYKNGNMFGIIRRWKEDIKSDLVEQYFADMPIDLITEGEYTNVRVWQGTIYFQNYDGEKMSWTGEKKPIGKAFSVAEAQRYKSIMFPKITTLIFEEFISDTFYLPDEPAKFDSIISSVARGREIKVLMIGNTINRFNPYYRHYSLEQSITAKAGQLDVYDFELPNDGGIIKIAVEMCDNVTDQRMFYGESADMIVNGHWLANSHPRLQYDYDEYTTIYEMFLFNQTLKYRMRLFKHNTLDNNYVWFVEPFTKEYKKRRSTRLISDIYEEDGYCTKGFQPLNDAERRAFALIDRGKIAFSDNLTGTEFYRLYEKLA